LDEKLTITLDTSIEYFFYLARLLFRSVIAESEFMESQSKVVVVNYTWKPATEGFLFDRVCGFNEIYFSVHYLSLPAFRSVFYRITARSV